MQGTLHRCPEFNTKSKLMVMLSLSLIHFLKNHLFRMVACVKQLKSFEIFFKYLPWVRSGTNLFGFHPLCTFCEVKRDQVSHMLSLLKQGLFFSYFLLLHNAFFERVWSNSLDFHSLCNFFGCLPPMKFLQFLQIFPCCIWYFDSFPKVGWPCYVDAFLDKVCLNFEFLSNVQFLEIQMHFEQINN